MVIRFQMGQTPGHAREAIQNPDSSTYTQVKVQATVRVYHNNKVEVSLVGLGKQLKGYESHW